MRAIKIQTWTPMQRKAAIALSFFGLAMMMTYFLTVAVISSALRPDLMLMITADIGLFTSSALMGMLAREALSKLVQPAPGHHLVSIAKFIFPKRVRERVLDQVIADMRQEYLEALQEGAIWHSRWIWLRGHLTFWTAVLSYLGVSAVDIVKKIWVANR